MFKYNDIFNHKLCLDDDNLITNFNHIDYGIKQLLWFYKTNDFNETDIKSPNDVIDDIDIQFSDEKTFLANINQDTHQLCHTNIDFSNCELSRYLKTNTLPSTNVINKLCFYNFSLYPDEMCPTGDIFKNDHIIDIKHNFTKKFIKDNENVDIQYIVKGVKFIRYYIDVNNKFKCKFIQARELFKIRSNL
jgi:hypothetical protein